MFILLNKKDRELLMHRKFMVKRTKGKGKIYTSFARKPLRAKQ